MYEEVAMADGKRAAYEIRDYLKKTGIDDVLVWPVYWPSGGAILGWLVGYGPYRIVVDEAEADAARELLRGRTAASQGPSQ